MAKTLTVEEAEERARRMQEDRLATIRGAVEARQNVTDVRAETEARRAEFERQIAEEVKRAEADDVRAYNAALSAGWNEAELKKIGLDEPEKKQRVQKRAAKKPATRMQPARTVTTTQTESAQAAHAELASV